MKLIIFIQIVIRIINKKVAHLLSLYYFVYFELNRQITKFENLFYDARKYLL